MTAPGPFDERGDTALSLLHEAIAALAHQLRSPLATLTNDLAYLKAVQPGADLGSSERACAVLREVLTKWQSRFGRTAAPRPVELSVLNRELAARALPQLESERHLVCADPASLAEALRTISALLGSTPRLAAHPDRCAFCWELNSRAASAVDSSSMVKLLSGGVPERVLEAVWADAILRLHGARPALDAGRLEMWLPLLAHDGSSGPNSPG